MWTVLQVFYYVLATKPKVQLRRNRAALEDAAPWATASERPGARAWSPGTQVQAQPRLAALRASVSLPTTTPAASTSAWATGLAARASAAPQPRLALTSELTPPAPLATGPGRLCGVDQPPLARRPSRPFPPSVAPASGRARPGGPTWARP